MAGSSYGFKILANCGIETQDTDSGDLKSPFPWVSSDTRISLLRPNVTIRDQTESARRLCPYIWSYGREQSYSLNRGILCIECIYNNRNYTHSLQIPKKSGTLVRRGSTRLYFRSSCFNFSFSSTNSSSISACLFSLKTFGNSKRLPSVRVTVAIR